MALDKTTKNLLIAGGLLAVGGLAYYFITRKGHGTRKIADISLGKNWNKELISFQLVQNMSNQELTDAQKLRSQGYMERLLNQPNSRAKLEDLGIEVDNSDPDASEKRVIDGSKLKITNGGKLNGIYNIFSVDIMATIGKWAGYVQGMSIERDDVRGDFSWEDIKVPHDLKIWGYDDSDHGYLKYKYGKDMPNWKIIK